jgi:hypothetical protein
MNQHFLYKNIVIRVFEVSSRHRCGPFNDADFSEVFNIYSTLSHSLSDTFLVEEQKSLLCRR